MLQEFAVDNTHAKVITYLVLCDGACGAGDPPLAQDGLERRGSGGRHHNGGAGRRYREAFWKLDLGGVLELGSTLR